jgi:hypothetical protein
LLFHVLWEPWWPALSACPSSGWVLIRTWFPARETAFLNPCQLIVCAECPVVVSVVLLLLMVSINEGKRGGFV